MDKKRNAAPVRRAPGLWERQRGVLDFALSSLLRKKGKLLGLVLVFTAIVALLASVTMFLSSMRREAAAILEGSPEILVQKLIAGRHDLIPASYAERVKGIRGVSGVAARLWGYWYDPVTKANYTIMVPGQDAGAGVGLSGVQPPEPGVIVVGEGISRTRGIFPGDSLSMEDHDGEPVLFTVGGLLSSDSALVASDLMLMSELDFRDLFGIPAGAYTDLAVRVPNPQEVQTVAVKLEEALPDTRVVLGREIRRTYEAVFDWRGGMLVTFLGGCILAFIVFSWDKASGLSAEEKREIGILKAIGWETSDVLLLKLWEGAAVTVTSFLAGFALAYAHVFLFNGALIASVIKGWSVLYPDFRLIPSIDAAQVATLFFLTVVPYTAATLIPSWKAAVIAPDAVMRA